MLNFLDNALDRLRRENDRQGGTLQEEDAEMIRRMAAYVAVQGVNRLEAELMRKDLTGMAQEGRLRGEGLHEVLGMDEKEFCREVVRNSRHSNRLESLLRLMKQVCASLLVLGIFFAAFFYGRYFPLNGEAVALVSLYYLAAYGTEVYVTPRFALERGWKRQVPKLLLSGVLALLILRIFWARDHFEATMHVDAFIAVPVLAAAWIVSILLYEWYIKSISKQYEQ